MIPQELEAEGIVRTRIRVRASGPRSVFGAVDVPVAAIRNGKGPCVVVMAGCHGDEYEGQLAVARIARRLSPSEVRGQVILLPHANPPAVDAGTRSSPLDGGNLNRAFPGDAGAGPTAAIAHALETALFPRASLVIDLHSGGDLVQYHPCAMLPDHADPAQRTEAERLAQASGLDTAFLYAAADDAPSSVFAACARAGVPVVGAEIGGGGGVTLTGVSRAEEVVLRVLHAIGALHEAAFPAVVGPLRVLHRPSAEASILAPCAGVFLPLVGIGSIVEAGQPAAMIHDATDPWRDPVEVCFPEGGVVLCRRVPAAVRRLDGLFKLGMAGA